jgi:hypothetical protein
VAEQRGFELPIGFLGVSARWSNYVAQKRLAFVFDWSVAMGDWSRRGGFGILPRRTFAQAGLRWCGGWRRANLRGSHDQGQIQIEGHVPLHRPN